jgi:tRNA-Thr(GGU) m(6)t(6)A37 methyltransferase TsaA
LYANAGGVFVIILSPIGIVHSPRRHLEDDGWGPVRSRIELDESVGPDALHGIEEYSHAEVLFYFDRVPDLAIERGARYPRGNTAWPRVGILAQRAKDRPNRLGSTIVEIANRQGRVLEVVGLDAVDGTPVVDIKPVMREFLPRTPVRQPGWATELMKHYWTGR